MYVSSIRRQKLAQLYLFSLIFCNNVAKVNSFAAVPTRPALRPISNADEILVGVRDVEEALTTTRSMWISYWILYSCSEIMSLMEYVTCQH